MHKVAVLYQDEALVAIAKPPGVAVHDAPGPGVSLLRSLRQQGWPELIPVHRLDKDTSGVLLLATTKEVAAELQRRWAGTRKTYLALCEGLPAKKQFLIDGPILENQTGKPERLRNAVRYYQREHPGEELPPLPVPKTSAVHPAGRTSRTAVRVLEVFPNATPPCCWLEVAPAQGRMHQIRVHLTSRGLPLLVDPLYGRRVRWQISPADPPLERLSLHAARVDVLYPQSQRRLALAAPLPADLQTVLDLLRR